MGLHGHQALSVRQSVLAEKIYAVVVRLLVVMGILNGVVVTIVVRHMPAVIVAIVMRYMPVVVVAIVVRDMLDAARAVNAIHCVLVWSNYRSVLLNHYHKKLI